MYALALDTDGHLLIGAGNKGDLYRVETRTLFSTLVIFPVAQVTALLPTVALSMRLLGMSASYSASGPV